MPVAPLLPCETLHLCIQVGLGFFPYHHTEDACSDGSRFYVFKALFHVLLDERHDEHPDQLLRDKLPECERMGSISFALTEEYPS
jgi:hypothetical protein